MSASNSRQPLFLSIFTAVLYGVLWNTPRENSFVLVLAFFACCYLSFRLVKQSTLQQIFYFGLVFRLLFIGIMPWLSQDFYRFIWDGLLFYDHINPYAYTPNALMESDVLFQSVLKEELWQNMGALSAGHYSNYPPINQLGFLLSVFGVSENLLISVVCMRLLLIAADIGIFFIGKQLLKVLHLPEKENWLVFSQSIGYRRTYCQPSLGRGNDFLFCARLVVLFKTAPHKSCFNFCPIGRNKADSYAHSAGLTKVSIRKKNSLYGTHRRGEFILAFLSFFL